MDETGHPGHRHRYRHPATAAALAVLAGLLVSCGGGEVAGPAPGRVASEASPGDAAGRSRSGEPGQAPNAMPSAMPSELSGALPGALPSRPSTRDTAVLAAQLERAMQTLRDRDAPADDVRRAGEFHQLAARALAARSPELTREVTARLRPGTATLVRGAVRASRSLGSMTAPEARLPRWRILAPPPAGELLDHYRRAERRTGVPWTYLAAIHLVETRMGRIRGVSTAGARGPMQFLPSTWDLYGGGGDIEDPRDAILGAARLLRSNGAPGDMAGALWHYNPSRSYVRAVSEYARTMQRAAWVYQGYWHWRVLYRHTRGTFVLPVGYPATRAVLLPGEGAGDGRR